MKKKKSVEILLYGVLYNPIPVGCLVVWVPLAITTTSIHFGIPIPDYTTTTITTTAWTTPSPQPSHKRNIMVCHQPAEETITCANNYDGMMMIGGGCLGTTTTTTTTTTLTDQNNGEQSSRQQLLREEQKNWNCHGRCLICGSINHQTIHCPVSP
ncbi:hypothetical protein BDB00DRAFT_879033 [Zychaea mexicana]|uniref:uncharacterized protein n=1 Tax=Zychaea mexicana TaxID=64656 RepID=UPI0022FDF7A6|nr:uncharacterized protein BDB00DRAFT_879033 [Zychaea mexicana]KAI9482624.1 hypothetical protein BDB00DRAFT_879033 [Zychaea mexicana]